MKIEKLGVRITDVPLLLLIDVTPQGILFNGAEYTTLTVAEVEELRDALTEALKAHTDLTTVTYAYEPPAPPAFTIGQELTGEEDLPPDTVVADCDGDRWRKRELGWVRIGEYPSSSVYSLPRLFDQFAPITIVSLPGVAA